MRAASIPARTASAVPLRSRRLLALAGDGRLVEQVRRGNDAAFEVLFERHGPAILGFCRHMLGSLEEAEDAVQHTFAAAYRDLQRGGEREIALKPWLFTIARNRCLSLLRARREVPAEADALESGEPSGAGLAERAEQRAELRRLLADVRELPAEQRAALLLTELGDLSHAEVAGVLDCEVSRVKGLVFRARSTLIARREARDTPCHSIREQLANLRGGALRRTELRLHLRECPGCRTYRDQVKHQRRMLAAALPVAPTLGLKSSVLAAIGIGGGSAGGLTAAGSVGGATVAKVAVAGVLAGGGMVAGDAVVDSERQAAVPPAPAQAGDRDAPSVSDPDAPGVAGGAAGLAAGRSARAGGGAPAGAKRTSGGQRRGRGTIVTPPASTPVRRGPPDKSLRSPHGAKAEPRGLAKGHTKQAKTDAGPWTKGGPKPNGGPKAKGGPKANRGPQANGGSKPNGGPQANGGPNANRGPRTNAGPKVDGAPRTSGGPKANGGPRAEGGPKANAQGGATPKGGAKLNGPTKPSSGSAANGRTKPNGAAKPNSTPQPHAAPKAKDDTTPPAGAKPDKAGQTP
jgi:RNA polymerase sigma factor (sigma-70 family)